MQGSEGVGKFVGHLVKSTWPDCQASDMYFLQSLPPGIGHALARGTKDRSEVPFHFLSFGINAGGAPILGCTAKVFTGIEVGGKSSDSLSFILIGSKFNKRENTTSTANIKFTISRSKKGKLDVDVGEIQNVGDYHEKVRPVSRSSLNRSTYSVHGMTGRPIQGGLPSLGKKH